MKHPDIQKINYSQIWIFLHEISRNIQIYEKYSMYWEWTCGSTEIGKIIFSMEIHDGGK
jgi:hypothetical protein